jgi:hypothetical protein
MHWINNPERYDETFAIQPHVYTREYSLMRLKETLRLAAPKIKILDRYICNTVIDLLMIKCFHTVRGVKITIIKPEGRACVQVAQVLSLLTYTICIDKE